MHALDGAVLVFFDHPGLVGKYGRGVAGNTRIEDEEVRFEFIDDLLPHRDALGLDRPVLVEGERCDASKSADVLVLLADRFLENVYLDSARFFGKLRRWNELTLVRAERVDQRHGECARRTEPRVPRQIGDADELNPARHAAKPQGLAKDAVLDLVDVVDDLRLRVSEANRLLKPPIGADEDVSV